MKRNSIHNNDLKHAMKLRVSPMQTCFPLLLFVSFLARIPAFADDAIIPQPPYNTGHGEYGGVGITPWVGADSGVFQSRYQQVYDAKMFQSIMPEGGWISGIGLRLFASTSGAGRNPVRGNIDIGMSTTAMQVDALSPVFVRNLGADARTVYSARGSSIMDSDPEKPGSGSIISTLPFSFGNGAFFYDPRKGNLLLDIVVSGLEQRGANLNFDAIQRTDDGVSCILGLENGKPSLEGIPIDSYGIVTRFTFSPVPEPSVLGMAAVGAVALGGLAANKHKKHAAYQSSHSTWCI